MLNTMRRFSQNFVAKALMALLVISFGVWGIGDALRSHGGNTLVQVGHERVSPQEFVGQYKAMQQAMASMNITGMDDNSMIDEILRQLIQTRLIRQWMHEAGLSVNRALLASTIQQNMQFHDLTGKFDAKAFKANLAARHLSEPVYLAQLQDEIAGKVLQTSLATDDIAMPSALEKMSNSAQTQTRDVLLVTIPAPAVDLSKVKDEDLKSYYESHKLQYMDPERRTLEYVTLDKNDISAVIDASITEDALKERYATNPKIAPSFEAAKPELLKQLRSEARDHVLQTVSTEMEDAMAGGASMGQALAKAGVKSQSKLLSNITADQIAGAQDELLHQVSAKGFALNDGETSGLQATKDGRYFMVNVKQTTPTAPKSFAAVKDEVRKQLGNERAESAQRDAVLKARAALHNSKNPEATIAELHLSSHLVSNIAHPKAGPDGKPQASGELPPLLTQSIFERGVNDIAGPAILPNGNVALAIVKAQHSSASSLSEKDSAAMRKQYQEALSQEAIGATLNHFVEQYPVQLNQPLLDQLTRKSDAQ